MSLNAENNNIFKAGTHTWQIIIKSKNTEQLDDFTYLIADSVSYQLDEQKYNLYFHNENEFEQALNLLNEFNEIKQLNLVIETESYENKDWVSEVQKSFKPIYLSDYVICASFNQDEIETDKHKIIIDPGRAFGTGEHATTFGCLTALQNIRQNEFKEILDMGCGTGVLAIYAKKIWPESKVTAIDIDPIAVEITKENAVINEVDLKSTIADGFENSKESYDLIIANILAKPLIAMANNLVAALNQKGIAILSGFLDNQLDEVTAPYIEQGMQIFEVIEQDNWRVVILKKEG